MLVIIILCVVGISINAKKLSVQKQANKEFEQYLQKDIYGTDVVTLINKAIDNNKISCYFYIMSIFYLICNSYLFFLNLFWIDFY